MRGKTAKLLRSVAKTNPYEIDDKNFNSPTRYLVNKDTGVIMLAPGQRYTYKTLKKFYKRRNFSTRELRAANQ